MTRLVHCVRCGRVIVGQSGQLCGACDKIVARQDDDRFRRQQRKDRAGLERAVGPAGDGQRT
jgi:hypothetical protein